ncbi:MAG: PaaI family thioesterase [Hydrocarboniphaga effusa]|nr:PaaI family thioesterase [Hydrocarboniphaga effusa]
MELKLNAGQIEKVILGAFPGSKDGWIRIEEVRPAYVRLRLPFHKWMLRPVNVISGPALFSAADTAMYALVLAHIGPEVLAVTADLGIRFLRKAPAGDVTAEARLLKLGKRLAVMEVLLRVAGEAEPVAHATGSYALPLRR